MTEHYVFTADRAFLRGYQVALAPRQFTPSFLPVLTVDFPEGRASYAESNTSQAGRHPSSRGPGQSGMSIDERLPMKEEHERRIAARIATEINDYLLGHPAAGWSLAVPPEMQKRILSAISDGVLRRMETCIAKNLAKVPVHELSAHFARAAEGSSLPVTRVTKS